MVSWVPSPLSRPAQHRVGGVISACDKTCTHLSCHYRCPRSKTHSGGYRQGFDGLIPPRIHQSMCKLGLPPSTISRLLNVALLTVVAGLVLATLIVIALLVIAAAFRLGHGRVILGLVRGVVRSPPSMLFYAWGLGVESCAVGSAVGRVFCHVICLSWYLSSDVGTSGRLAQLARARDTPYLDINPSCQRTCLLFCPGLGHQTRL